MNLCCSGLAGVLAVYSTAAMARGLDILPTSHVVSCFQANILEEHMFIMTNTVIHEYTDFVFYTVL